MIRKSLLPWHCLPTIVFLIGALSIILLVWVIRINERLHADFALVDAMEHAQIQAATFHLWLEESIAGDEKIDRQGMWKDLGQANLLIDAVLNGGKAADGSVLRPLTDPELRVRAEALRSLLVDFQAIARDRMQDPERSGIGTVMDHRFDEVFREITITAGELEKTVEKRKNHNQGRSSSLVLGILSAWIFIVIAATVGLFSRELKRRSAEEKLLRSHEQVLAQAEELKEHREHLMEMVGKRTAELTASNRRLRLEIGERMETEKALKESQKELRRLSSRLLSAQEEERRKISRELHDELGQSLTLMKFQLRSVERQLRDDQGTLRRECANTLQYMNTVIENVRRLSRDLCPLVLEDLGLARALQWLADNIAKNYNIRIVLDIADIDRLFPGSVNTSIYRIVQESLTNIVKHSGAGNASVSVRREDQNIVVSVEDDGKGFDAAAVAAQDPAERGLGLTSMAERAGMLGGSLALWSKLGKGTRISFSIPAIEKEDSHESLSHRAG